MKNEAGVIKPFIIGKLPKDKYTDANELARDIASVLEIRQDQIAINLIALNNLKGEKGDRGKQGVQGPPGILGPVGPVGPPGPAMSWKDAWITETPYDLYDLVTNDGKIYISKLAHTSGTTSEPGVGASWESAWDVFFELNFEFGAYTVDGAVAAQGYIPITIAGVTYRLLARTNT